MTRQELETLQAAGTGGEWRIIQSLRGGATYIWVGDDHGTAIGWTTHTPNGLKQDEANAALIVAAVNALPVHLEIIAQLEAALRELPRHLNRVSNGHCTVCESPRLYGERGEVQACENPDCWSHQFTAALEAVRAAGL